MKWILRKGEEVKEFPNQTQAADFLGMSQMAFSRHYYQSNVINGWRIIQKNDSRVNRREWSQLYEELLLEIDTLRQRCETLEKMVMNLR